MRRRWPARTFLTETNKRHYCRSNARSDHAVLELFCYFFLSREKSKTRIICKQSTYSHLHNNPQKNPIYIKHITHVILRNLKHPLKTKFTKPLKHTYLFHWHLKTNTERQH